ncbi:hypothetical protein BZG36_00802 [Bifiguratus adelaidae]|uniref:Replication factor A C-terminal domain-containing protein n=1 Tax=Bifiguratus adelaidae TaxID=1938954 RepID=A0A261Y714_9FUNG|nr:hypothetical protein BZG36_00802 [Bifiguratus adelaidae]
MIVQVTHVNLKSIVSYNCAICAAKLISPSSETSSGDTGPRFYCPQCRRTVEYTSDNFSASFRLAFTVREACTPVAHTLVAFDDIAEKVIGCSALEWEQRVRMHPETIQLMSNQLRGAWFRVTLRTKRRVKKHAHLIPDRIIATLTRLQ